MQDVVIIGTGAQARFVIDIINRQCDYKYNCIQVPYHDKVKETGINNVVIAVGDNYTRFKIHEHLINENPDYEFPSIIDHSANIYSRVKIGKGCLIMQNTVICMDAVMGDFCLMSAKSCLQHDCIMEDFSSLSGDVSMGGRCHFGKFSAVNLNATIFSDLIIGENSVIGAGAVVTKDVQSNSLMIGNPARRVRDWKFGERFLK